MFDEKLCDRCGVCFSKCPFLELPIKKAKETIDTLISDRKLTEALVKNCAGCSYCNVICPKQANPYDLIREINVKNACEKGIRSLSLISEETPLNLMSIGLEIETEKKLKNLEIYNNLQKSSEMFYLGCSLSYIYTDLAETKLLSNLPKMGGMKYCCGGYVNSFGKHEVIIKGNELLKKFNELGVKKIITFCPGCETMMMGTYPGLIPEFKNNITGQNISEYLVEQYHKGELEFTTKIEKRVTFHDPCAWRGLNRKIYDGPRELLEIMGAEVVEMKHNREKSLCCGLPVLTKNYEIGKKIAESRVVEAEEVNADIIALSCTGCFSLSGRALKKNIDVFNITELAQIAAGEKPPHRVYEVSKSLNNHIMQKISGNMDLVSKKYIIKEGKIKTI